MVNRKCWLKIQLLVFVLSISALRSQTWQFVKPYYELSHEWLPGKIKRLSNGNVMRVFEDYYRTIIEAYTASGDSLWYQKVENLHINDYLPLGDSVYFCGSFSKQIQIGNQTFTCPDTCTYGILGIMDNSGNFKNIKILPAKYGEVFSIFLKNNSLSIGGAYSKYFSFDSHLYTGTEDEAAFIIFIDKNLNALQGAHSDGGNAGVIKHAVDDEGNVWVLGSVGLIVKWGNRYISHPDTEYCTDNGQSLFKLDANLNLIWTKSIFVGIGPERYGPYLLMNSDNRATLTSKWSWGSGAKTSCNIRQFDSEGVQRWAKGLNSYYPIIAQDQSGNIYSLAANSEEPNYFTIYKFTSEGEHVYAKKDSLWHHSIYSWEFVSEDEFYALGGCNDNTNGCKSGFRFLTYYGFDKPVLVKNEYVAKSQISIFPNPSSEIVNLSLARPVKNLSIRMINSVGAVVYQSEMRELGQGAAIELRLSEVKAGVYCLIIQNDGFSESRSLVID
jgi:hypothetical protein